ncbi:MAG: hypothetical protein DI538_11030 [Azospira oryzae]|jgi:N-formylmaleamate deformylase|nr:MAG: hypothetical protein DI538_11030 [Azospira oryzae]
MKYTLLFLLTLTTTIVVAQTPAAQITVTGKGKPVLFIPHIGCPPEMWKDVVKELAKRNTCHTVSLAGFAGSAPIDSAYTRQYISFLQQYMQSKKLKEITVVGMNYGGFLALQLAQHPSVGKLVVIDTYPFLAQVLNPKATLQDAQTYATQMKAGYLSPSDKDFEAIVYENGKAMITNDTIKAKTYAQWVALSDRKTIATALADQMAADLRPILPFIKVPVLIIGTWYFGKTYKKMPIEEGSRMHEEFYRTLPNHTIRLTETAKDFIHWDDPEWFVNELKSFITK